MKLLFVFAILFLIGIVEAQRGGGRGGGSRSSSSSRSSYRSYGSRGYSPPRPWTTTDYYIFGGIGTLVAGGLILAVVTANKNEEQRKKTLQAMMMDYEGRAQSVMCTLEPSKQEQIIDWFMKSNWTTQYFLSNGGSQFMKFKVKDLKKKNNFLYQITVDGNDPIGSSTLTGRLSLQGDYIGLYLQKSYHNRSKAGQTGSFTILIYEGVQQEEQFVGNWFYKGYQSSAQYSGNWKMFHD